MTYKSTGNHFLLKEKKFVLFEGKAMPEQLGNVCLKPHSVIFKYIRVMQINTNSYIIENKLFSILYALLISVYKFTLIVYIGRTLELLT